MLELGKLIVAFELPFAAFFAAVGFVHGTKRLFRRYKRFSLRELLILITVLALLLGTIHALITVGRHF
jgi:uncharacterized membrane protein YqaE (UPF0057 family)